MNELKPYNRRNLKHGAYVRCPRLYSVWATMIHRCGVLVGSGERKRICRTKIIRNCVAVRFAWEKQKYQKDIERAFQTEKCIG